jgi:hypothetical protein
MSLGEVSYVAIIVVTIINIILGMIWYSPQVLGKAWQDAMHMSDSDAQYSVKSILGAFVVALITAWVMAIFIDWLHATTVAAGVITGFFVWLGFVATTHFSGVLWARKPLKAYFIDAGFYLVNFIIMGGILGAWQS